MHPSQLELLFWAAGLLGHCSLLAVLWARKRARTFPFFTSLIVLNVIRSVTLLIAHGRVDRDVYLVVYFAFAVLDLALQLCVVYELASQVFCPTGTWAPDVRRGALILAFASVVIALALASMPAPPERTQLKVLLDRGNLFSSALLCQLFLGMIAFSVTARLPWKTHVARLAQGLGFYSLVGLLTEAGHNITGMVRSLELSHQLTLLRESTYLICLGYWIVSLWREAPAPKELPEEMRHQLFTVQRRLEYDLRKLRILKR